MGSELSFAGVHLRLHNPTCFNESGFGTRSSLATKEICDTASQYKRIQLGLPSGHGLTLSIDQSYGGLEACWRSREVEIRAKLYYAKIFLSLAPNIPCKSLSFFVLSTFSLLSFHHIYAGLSSESIHCLYLGS